MTAADIIATAAVISGKYGSSLPMYGVERRGAPVVSFVRIDDHPIRQKTQIYAPDCLIILDPRQKDLPQVYEGIKPEGTLVLNFTKAPDERPHPHISAVAVVDATSIALEEIGVPAFNTCLLGAFSAATGWLELDSILSALEKSFSGEPLKGNIRSARRGYQEVKVVNWQ